MKTYRLALLTGWHWEDMIITPDNPIHAQMEHHCRIILLDGSYKISRFCMPDGTPIQNWKTLPIKIDPPLHWILFWWIYKQVQLIGAHD